MKSLVHQKPSFLISLLTFMGTLLSAQAGASEAMPLHHHGDHQTQMQKQEPVSMSAMEDHSQHMRAMESMKNQDYLRSVEEYDMPSLKLVDMNGKTVLVDEVLNSDQPMMVNFIYTSCTTICPILSATFSSAQHQMGEAAKPVKWISISIDPEYDTPARLREYAQRFHANDNWQFITGELDQIIALQKAFGVYFGSKANHKPVTLMRAGRDKPWVRLEGLTSGAELVAEYQQIAQ